MKNNSLYWLSYIFFTLSLSISLAASGEEKPVTLSMVELLANGEDFDGTRVTVIGIPFVGFEANRLFFSLDAYKIGDTASAVYLRWPESLEKELVESNGSYTYITGRYSDIKRKVLKKNEFVIGPPESAGTIEVDSILVTQQ